MPLSKRLCTAVVTATIAVVMSAGAPADAASTTVDGTNAYRKLNFNNGANAVVFKVYAPGGRCVVKYVTVKFRDRDGTKYAVDAGCYPGSVWATSLTRGTELVDCAGFTMKYNADKNFWKAVAPRSCLAGLADRVKVTQSWVDDYSPAPGEAGPTAYVARG